jgi:hypothetical protein
MADKKISELTAATSVSLTDVLPIVQVTSTKKITPVVLFGNIPTDVKYAGFIAETGTPDTVATGAASITTAITYLSNVGGSLATVTLANGVQGQEKTFLMTARTSNDIDLVPANLIGTDTKITFSAVGQTVKLKFMNSQWCVLSVYGAVVS